MDRFSVHLPGMARGDRSVGQRQNQFTVGTGFRADDAHRTGSRRGSDGTGSDTFQHAGTDVDVGHILVVVPILVQVGILVGIVVPVQVGRSELLDVLHRYVAVPLRVKIEPVVMLRRKEASGAAAQFALVGKAVHRMRQHGDVLLLRLHISRLMMHMVLMSIVLMTGNIVLANYRTMITTRPAMPGFSSGG